MMANKRCPRCGNDTLRKNGHDARGKQFWICRPDGVVCYKTLHPDSPVERKQNGQPKNAKPLVFKRAIGGKKRFVVTSAQNGTPVNKPFLESLKVYCAFNDAELIVIPLRYKNPTSKWSQSQENAETWDPSVIQFLCNQRKALGPNLVLLGDVKVQPTAVSPLTGFEALTASESSILGHTKMQLRTVPTPQGKYPKILATTGAVTVKNYTDSRAGKVGEFHHVCGALVVELVGKKFHLRQLNADSDGEFIDLNMLYTPRGEESAPPALALVMGDTHVDFIDPKVQKATFVGEDSIVEALTPQHLVWHDLLDGYAVNPHHHGNPFNAIAKNKAGRGSIQEEVERAVKFVFNWTPDGCQSVIVPSNHDDFLSRWIINTDWRSAPGNAAFYLETALAMVKHTKLGVGGTEYPAAFPYIGRQLLPTARWLARDESFTLAGIELGLHGDKGPNGSRGSIRNLKRIGVKSVIGHTHSPGIDEGCYQVGTSTRLKLEYTSGPSSWLNTHAVVYANGKRSLIHIIDGEWHG